MERPRAAGPRVCRVAALHVVGVLALSGCQVEPPLQNGSSWAGTLDTVPDGRVYVSNPQEPMWGSGRRGAFVEETRIGRVEGEGPDLFGEVGFLELDALGRLWVFESQAQELRVFEADGTFVRTGGGRGEGPGEFQWVTGMSWGPGGRLWVLDVGTMRFSVLDTAGIVRASHRIEGGSMIVPWPGGFDRQGRLHHYSRRRRVDGDGYDLVLVRYDTLMTPGDTVLIPPRAPSEIFELRGETSYMSVPVPFAPRDLWRLTPEGKILRVNTGAYEMVVHGPKGDTLRIVSKEWEAVPVRKEDLERAMAALAGFTDAGGFVDPARIPSVQPALRDVFVDGEGRTWVLPGTVASDGSSVLDLFDPEGRYLGPVDVPFHLEAGSPPVIRDGVFLAVTRDGMGVPYVVGGAIRLPEPRSGDV